MILSYKQFSLKFPKIEFNLELEIMNQKIRLLSLTVGLFISFKKLLLQNE